MNWEILSKEDFITSQWSGGTTTQLAISPADALYADKDFLWRLSSATVELDHSDFTPLPDYNRLLSVLDGSLAIRIGNEEKKDVKKFSVLPFDGGTSVESWGKCRDFNLMLRKGRCAGYVEHVALAPGDSRLWNVPVTASCVSCSTDLAVFCISGDAALKDGPRVSAGGLLLNRHGDLRSLDLSSVYGADLMFSVIWY